MPQKLPKLPKKKNQAKTKQPLVWWQYLKLILTLISLVIIYAYLEPHLLSIKKIKFNDPDLPQNFIGKKIVFLTDIHYGPYFSDLELARLVKKTNQLQPDIIILGGDYTDPNLHLVTPVFNQLKNLKAKYGIYAVLGNHDYWKEGNFTTHAIKDAGITLLDNQATWIEIAGERIRLGGVADSWYGQPDYRPTLADTKTTDLVILVSHNPDYSEKINPEQIDLILAGHHHGGQITFFGLYAPVIYSHYGQKYRYAWVKNGALTTFVSQGIGTTGPPLRFFAVPEIVVIELGK